MQIHFKHMDPAVNAQAQDRLYKRIMKLERLLDSSRLFRGQTFVEVNREVGGQHTGDIWRARINVDVQGERYHAEARKNEPEKAAHAAIKEMEQELRHAQAKRLGVRREGSMWKSFQQNFQNFKLQ